MSETRATSPAQMTTSYGYREIGQGEKQTLVNDVFDRVAKRYDVMNDIMSGGMHRIWKSALVSALAPPRYENCQWKSLDVAGGTGDIAFRIVEAATAAHVTVIDINEAMLAVGRERAQKLNVEDNVDFVLANAEDLPVASGKFDACTIAFGIRNVPQIDLALAEAYRVLKPGGRFLCLEFSEVDMPMLDKLYEQWSFKFIPAIGKIVTGDDEPYQYLVESVRKFPDKQKFADMIRAAGFENVSHRSFTGGVVALHSGWKI